MNINIKYIYFIIIFFPFLTCSTDLGTEPIPDDVTWKTGHINYLTPPDGFKAAVAWMAAIHDTRKFEASKIEVDWLRLYARVEGIDQLIGSAEYDDGKVNGGMYFRNPSFYGNISFNIPPNFENECLILKPSDFPNMIWHWYTSPRSTIPDNVERCWMEAKIRITGPALVQVGLDYYKDVSIAPQANVNTKEAGVSDWCYTQNEWQIVSFAKP